MNKTIKCGMICYANHEISVIRRIDMDEIKIEVIRLNEIFAANPEDLVFPKISLTEHEIFDTVIKCTYRYLSGLADDACDAFKEPISTMLDYLRAKREATDYTPKNGGNFNE